MKAETHPGRSYEFLSRLHDGELTPGERAHFESHRAHCAECRRAAAEFEAALSLYRSTPTSPAASDLASRVLRRLQQANPRRRPFGIFYGIDLRWASAFAAALIVMLIGSAVYLRQTPQRVPSAATPIPVQVEIREAPRRDEVGQKTAPSSGSDRRQVASAAEETEQEAKKRDPDTASPAGPAPSAAGKLEDRVTAESPRIAAAAPPAPLHKEKDASKQTAASRAPAERAAGSASRDDASGGEPSATAAYDFAAANQAPPFRFDVTPLDGKGTAPARVGQPTDLSASYRGRSFVLEVSASGEVTEALPIDEARQRKAAEPTALEPLKAFRFQPGDGPRKLLLRIQ